MTEERCSGCGDGIGNAGIDLAAVVHVLLADGTPQTFHLCNAKCAPEFLPRALSAALAANPVSFYYDRNTSPSDQAESEVINEPRPAAPGSEPDQRQHGAAVAADPSETPRSDQ